MMSRLKGDEALQFTVSAVARVMKVKWRELPKLLSSMGIDALVLDDYDFYSAVVPMYLGMPYAVLANAFHFDYSGNTPLCVYGWAHENTPEARERNRQGVSEFAHMLIRSNAELIAEVERTGIRPNWEDPSCLLSDRPRSRNVLANLTLQTPIARNSSVTPVRFMTEKVGLRSVFRGTD
jgi:zeaxanthin glucosyltransferase